MRIATIALLLATACSPDDPTGTGCPEIWNPVCGVDGQTYDNPCSAQAAGVTVAHPGECGGVDAGNAEDAGNANDAGNNAHDAGGVADAGSGGQDAGLPTDRCGTRGGVQCPEGAYCNYAPESLCGRLDNGGLCEWIPTDRCPPVIERVCGCDGQTYDNPCFAALAGTAVAHEGECREAPGCGVEGGEECGVSQFCSFGAGNCEPLPEGGSCVQVPRACPDVYEPVCGCDGQTYGNSCEAISARVQVAADGECQQQLGCGVEGGAVCNPGQHCLFGVGNCDVPPEGGTCETIMRSCREIYAPVCGCDGQTYGNRCEAINARVQISAEGECAQANPGDNGICGPRRVPIVCSPTHYCDRELGQCPPNDRTSAGGSCEPRPGLCPRILMPVCGCDNVTYDNQCEANRAGTSVRSRGRCP